MSNIEWERDRRSDKCESVEKANRYESKTNMSREEKRHNRFVNKNGSEPDRVDARVEMNADESRGNEFGITRSRKLRHMYTKDLPVNKPNLPKSVSKKSLESFDDLLSKANRYERETKMSGKDKLFDRSSRHYEGPKDRVNHRISQNVYRVKYRADQPMPWRDQGPGGRKDVFENSKSKPVRKPNLPKSISQEDKKVSKGLLDPFSDLLSKANRLEKKRKKAKFSPEPDVFSAKKPNLPKSLVSLVKKSSETEFPKLTVKKGGVKDPGALAAWIGIKKYGKARFEKMSHKKHKKSNKPGGGNRFKKLEHELEEE